MFLNLDEFEWVEEAPSQPKDGYPYTMIENGDWVSSGKWEYQEGVVLHNETGKYYKYELSRSGSYYTEYYYPHIEDDKGVKLKEVKPVEKTIVVTNWEYI